MLPSPILGQAYVARSSNAAANRMVNLFPEVVDEGQTTGFLNRAPGLRFLQEIGAGPIRGLWTASVGDSFYVVSGNSVYRAFSLTDAPVLIGSVTGTGPVSITDNGTQIFFACNPDGFIYNQQTNEFQQITDPDFAGAVTVAFIDNYFLFNQPNSQKIWVTQLLDGTSIDPLDFSSADGAPDGVVGLIVDHREAWIFGTNSTEVWYNSGGVGLNAAVAFPLTRISGAFNEIGCAAPYTIAKMDNGVFWLSQDSRGQGMIYRANGYVGQRISTHAVEWQIQQYPRIDNALAYTYQQDGHNFYVLIFPSANDGRGATWVYDAATQTWHERAGWSGRAFTRHRSNCQCNFQGAIIVGDYRNGNVYALDLDTYTDGDDFQRWLRAWRALPPNANKLVRSAQHSLQLVCESGVGLALDPDPHPSEVVRDRAGDDILLRDNSTIMTREVTAPAGADPQVMLRFSDDGGHKWSNEHWRSMGRIGATQTRVIWRRLGMTERLRDRVYEVSGTAPVKVAIVGAELSVDETNA